jgi:hypothetical protein
MSVLARMIRAGLLPAAAVVLAAGCGTYHTTPYHPEMYSDLHPARPTESVSRILRCEEIVFWEKDPKNKQRAGYLETREVTVAGSLETVRQYLVFDLNQRSPFGMINDFGKTHLWRQAGAPGNGRWEPIGNYELKEAAKALFRRDNKTNVAFEPMEYMPPDR